MSCIRSSLHTTHACTHECKHFKPKDLAVIVLDQSLRYTFATYIFLLDCIKRTSLYFSFVAASSCMHGPIPTRTLHNDPQLLASFDFSALLPFFAGPKRRYLLSFNSFHNRGGNLVDLILDTLDSPVRVDQLPHHSSCLRPNKNEKAVLCLLKSRITRTPGTAHDSTQFRVPSQRVNTALHARCGGKCVDVHRPDSRRNYGKH